MNILVTGANGFLGLNLVKKLIKKGHIVYALNKEPINFKHPKMHAIVCDLLDISLFLQGIEIDIVFHTAASIIMDNNREATLNLINDNILATKGLADFIIDNKIKKLIHSSTCSVYKENYKIDYWIDEESKLQPQNIYAISKLASEYLLESSLKSTNCELIILRYSSIYGYHQNKNLILPTFINNAINNNTINIFNSGKRIQDYVYIDDVVDANLYCIDKKLPFNTILNIGSGERISDLKLAELIKNNWDSNSKINILYKSNDIETILNYDISKAQSILGYSPLTLKEGLKAYKKTMLYT